MLEKIMRVFWANGFAATSLDDLAATTGLSRSSLYAAYGGKVAMYLAAMDLFARQMQETAVPALSDEETLTAALTGFYKGALTLYFGSRKQALGCMVFTTAVADAGSDKKIAAAVTAFMDQLDGALTQCILAHAPHLASDDARDAARQAAGLLINLASRARAGGQRADLDRMAEGSADLIAKAVAA